MVVLKVCVHGFRAALLGAWLGACLRILCGCPPDSWWFLLTVLRTELHVQKSVSFLQDNVAAKPAPHSREALPDLDSAFDPAAAAAAAAKAQVCAARLIVWLFCTQGAVVLCQPASMCTPMLSSLCFTQGHNSKGILNNYHADMCRRAWRRRRAASRACQKVRCLCSHPARTRRPRPRSWRRCARALSYV